MEKLSAKRNDDSPQDTKSLIEENINIQTPKSQTSYQQTVKSRLSSIRKTCEEQVQNANDLSDLSNFTPSQIVTPVKSNKTSQKSDLTPNSKVQSVITPNSNNDSIKSSNQTLSVQVQNSIKEYESVTRLKPILRPSQQETSDAIVEHDKEILLQQLLNHFGIDESSLNTEFCIFLGFLNDLKGCDKKHQIEEDLSKFLIFWRREDTWTNKNHIDMVDFATFRLTKHWYNFKDEWYEIQRHIDHMVVRPFIMQSTNRDPLKNSLLKRYNEFQDSKWVIISIFGNTISDADMKVIANELAKQDYTEKYVEKSHILREFITQIRSMMIKRIRNEEKKGNKLIIKIENTINNSLSDHTEQLIKSLITDVLRKLTSNGTLKYGVNKDGSFIEGHNLNYLFRPNYTNM